MNAVPTMYAIESSGRSDVGESEGTRSLAVMLVPLVQEIAVL